MPQGRGPQAGFGRQSSGQSEQSGYGRRADARPVDLKAIAEMAMAKYGFVSVFPPKVMAKANELRADAPQMNEHRVKDLRHLLWSSIDNIDTLDLDQIEYCERGKGGEISIWVGVADVDVYVPKDSLLDQHAHENTTSVYTGIEIFPMLPDRLSKDLSSLPMEQDRLAMVVEFSVLPKGSVRAGKVYRALVRNKAKLVYEQVGAWLEGREAAPKLIAESPELQAQIRLQDEASQRLGKYRAGQGALELETLKTKAIIQNERVLGLYVEEDDRAKRIIENFMIGANGVMSSLLEKSGRPTIQRVVRTPKYWSEIVQTAREHGSKLPNRPDAAALAKFLDKERAKDPERFPDLSLAIVKLLGPGEYVLYDKHKPVGHFCMAVTSYTHSTAPNRRYPDVVIQRLMKALLSNAGSPYGKEELTALAERCTEREHAAKKVERFVTKAEGAVLLAGRIGQTFDAMVTGASEKGVYARLMDPPVEGKLMAEPKQVHVGQKVRIKLVNLDPWMGFIDFALAR
ncbi:Ribonuclease R [uncultured archaeon]|nr:Ribonuclease R [uncultured archaeon]